MMLFNSIVPDVFLIENGGLVDDLIQCIEQQEIALSNPAWVCTASLSEMYAFVHAALSPHWDAIYQKHGLASAFWCALYQMRSPIATFIWDTFVCPLRNGGLVPFLLMPTGACERTALPPSDILPRHPGSMYPAGFDAHAFGIFFGNLLVDGREPESSVFKLFPEDICGYAYGPQRQNFTHGGVKYAAYSPKCPHNIAIHSLIATIVKRSPDPVHLNVSRLLGLHLAPHGFGHGLFPRFSVRHAMQICRERESSVCTGGVSHSIGNWLRPKTGLQQLDAILPCIVVSGSGDELSLLRLDAAHGYFIPSFKQNATFGQLCNFNYYRAFSTYDEWARQC